MHITTFVQRQQTTTFIPADDGAVALHLTMWQSVAEATDHLGSYCAITNADRKTIQHNYFDPWGNTLRLTRGISPPPPEPHAEIAINFALTFRGFTGHEHYPEFKIINMNGRLYDPVIGRFFSPDKYVANSSFTQDFNRYTYARNCPLMYTDPSGEFLFFFPTIGWSRDGGLSIGLNFIVGIPGIASVSAGVGYNLSSNDLSFTVSATAAFNTIYASVGTKSGLNAGWSVGLSPQMGFPLSSNLFSAGLNYNFKQGEFSGNISAWTISKNGVRFNPSFSAAICPQQFTNLVRGQGFRSNSQVFDRMMSGTSTCQDIINYFGFDVTYDPIRGNGSGAGKTTIGNYAFEGNYDRLAFIASHEMRHTSNTLAGKNKGGDWDNPNCPINNREEWDALMYNYQNQGLYPNHGVDLVDRIGISGRAADLYLTHFNPEWWHFIYKIPRLW